MLKCKWLMNLKLNEYNLKCLIQCITYFASNTNMPYSKELFDYFQMSECTKLIDLK